MPIRGAYGESTDNTEKQHHSLCASHPWHRVLGFICVYCLWSSLSQMFFLEIDLEINLTWLDQTHHLSYPAGRLFRAVLSRCSIPTPLQPMRRHTICLPLQSAFNLYSYLWEICQYVNYSVTNCVLILVWSLALYLSVLVCFFLSTVSLCLIYLMLLKGLIVKIPFRCIILFSIRTLTLMLLMHKNEKENKTTK